MNTMGVAGIYLNDDLCGRCSFCSSICPYEAISIDPVSGEVIIDVEKCQFCGLCYSACPVNAIEIKYYDYATLLKQVEKAVSEKKIETLVLMCRGNSPPSCEVDNILKDEGFIARAHLPIRVPCVGRVPLEFILRTLSSGIKKILTIRCEEDFCRFKDGSRISNQRFLLLKQILEKLGFKDDTLKIITYARKAIYDTDKCVGCDKCVFICPYEAIEVESLATPKIDLEKCMGCGACALVCPHMAIQIEGFEYEILSTRIHRYGEAAKKLKAQGISPLILAFVCQWSEFSALDDPEIRPFNEVVSMEIPCFKALDPNLVIEALYSGFDGVLAVVCSDVDCKLDKGYDIAERNAIVLKRALKEMKLKNRFETYITSPRNVGEFNEHLKMFIKRVNALGPLAEKKWKRE